MTLGERREPDGRIAEQLRRHHRVEEVLELEGAVALEDVEVVLGGVEDLADLLRREDRRERRQLGGTAERERIDQVDALARADLHQTGLVVVVIEAVGFGIDRDHGLAEEVTRQRPEVALALDALVVSQRQSWLPGGRFSNRRGKAARGGIRTRGGSILTQPPGRGKRTPERRQPLCSAAHAPRRLGASDPIPIRLSRPHAPRRPRSARPGPARADAALLFAVGSDLDIERASAAACEALGTRAVAAVLGHAVATGEREDEAGPAVAVLALCGLDAVAFRVSGASGVEEAIGPEIEALLGRSTTENDLVVVFADPLALDATRLCSRPRGPATGDGRRRRRRARRRRPRRCSPAADRGGARWAPAGWFSRSMRRLACAVSQGCRPITDPLHRDARRGQLDPRTGRQARPRRLSRDCARAARGGSASCRRAIARCDSAQRAPPRRSAATPGSRDASPASRPRDAPSRCPSRCASAPYCASRCATPISPAKICRATLAGVGGAASAGLYLSSFGARSRAVPASAGSKPRSSRRALAPAPIAGLFGSFEIAPLAGSLELLAHAGVLIAIP